MNRKRVRILRVIDGDTVEVLTRRGLFRRARRDRVRLYGIDAPETSQSGGTEATDHLRRLIGSKPRLWMDTLGADQYGRTVGLLYRKKNRPQYSYNYMMVRDGQARAYLTSPQDRERFSRAEAEAARRGWGIWKTGNAAAPWEYRREQRGRLRRRGRVKLILILAATVALAVAAAYLYLDFPRPSLP